MRNSNKYLLAFILFFILVNFSFSQFIYFPYYGKNKVLYEKFDWNHYETDHFDIHYYVKDIQILKTVAELAESAYQRISQTMKHQLSAKVPLLYYKTSTDFEQTNLFQMPEGVLGVAEPMLYRIAIQGDLTLDETQDLVEHELTHIFEYDLLWGSPGGALYAVRRPPLWVFEGFSEYNTQNWTPWSALIVRDAVINDRIPELKKSGDLHSSFLLPRDPAYDFGHAIYDFIEYKHGKNGIREFWHSLERSSSFRKQDSIKKVLKMTPKEFNYEFKKYLRSKNKKFLLRDNPEDYSITLGPEFPLNAYYFSFSHALSPSGDIIAALTFSIKDNDIDIVLISTKDGKVIRNVTKGHTLKYEHIKYEVDSSKGRDISWSADGDRIVFFARSGQKHSLFILNALNGKTLDSIKIPYDQPASPCFLPDGKEILFTASSEGKHDVFKINLNTKKILNLTGDDLYEKAPAISPDGKYVAYTIHIDVFDKLFISPLNDLKNKTQLTFGRGNTISPEFSKDSKEICFSGDMREAFNIYSLNLETGDLRRYTDVRTGNFFPAPLPNNSSEFIFSSFNKGSFQIFKSKLEGKLIKSIKFVEKKPEEKFRKFEPIVKLEINKDNIKTYKGIKNLYLSSRPPVDAILSTDGSLYGGTAISFTDLMADYAFNIMAYQVRAFRSYYFSFLNQKNRLQYMASVFQYTQFYYPPYAYYDPYLYNYLSYNDSIASREISGANISAYYPFNRYYRIQGSFGYSHYEEDFYDPYMKQTLYGRNTSYNMFWNGNLLSASLSLIGETTVFNYYGPTSGNTFRFSLTQAVPISEGFFRNTTVELDLRQYLYVGANALFAFRFNGFASKGRNPYVFYFGGNNQVRSVYYSNIIGNEGWYSDLEFRFPLVNAASTIIGQIGPVRGALFADIARSKLKDFPAQIYFWEYVPNKGYILSSADAVGSYGFGFQFFFLGLPFHVEFVKMLKFPDFSRPFDFDIIGDYDTKIWIGFDF